MCTGFPAFRLLKAEYLLPALDLGVSNITVSSDTPPFGAKGAGRNSIVWHTADIGAPGVWTDGTDHWESLGAANMDDWIELGRGVDMSWTVIA